MLMRDGVFSVPLPIGPLNTRSGLERVPKSEPATYQPISRRLCYCAFGIWITTVCTIM